MMDKIGRFVCFIAIMLTSALVETFAVHTMWLWFMTVHYGPGPTFGEWYAIGTIISMISMRVTTNKTPPENAMAKWWEAMVNRAAILMVALGLAYLTGTVFGWVTP